MVVVLLVEDVVVILTMFSLLSFGADVCVVFYWPVALKILSYESLDDCNI